MSQPPSRGVTSTPAGGRSARRALALVVAWALLASAVFAGLAVADPVNDAVDPVADVLTAPGETTGQDTTYTPTPRDGDAAYKFGWRQVGGEIFDDPSGAAGAQAGNPDGMNYSEAASPTAHTVDFYTVSFLNPDNGLAGGAACPEGTPNTNEALQACLRVPVIYRYQRASPALPPEWHEVFRGTEAGYVGAVAWLNARKAVAVGGSGCYPRREDPAVGCAEGQARSAQENVRIDGREEEIAGDARAWELQNDAWSAIPRDQLPERMTGLTALTFSSRTSDCRAATECGFAGGLGQIWTWVDGKFDATASSNYESTYINCPPGQTSCNGAPTAQDGPFRVRQIATAPVAYARLKVVAVTAGCCYRGQDAKSQQDPTLAYARRLNFTDGAWTIRRVNEPQVTPPTPEHTAHAATLPDSAFGVFIGLRPRGSSNPESAVCASIVMSPGGPPEGLAARMPSRIYGQKTFFGVEDKECDETTPPNYQDPWSPELQSVRLVAGGGDDSNHSANLTQTVGQPSGTQDNGGVLDESVSDGILDWAVGEIRATHRAAAYTTTAQSAGLDPPYPLDCPSDTSAVPPNPQYQPDISAQCKPATPEQLDAQARSQGLVALPSYALNAYTSVGTSGIGWAVGDRGALLRRGGADGTGGGSAAEPNPAKLGGGAETRLSDRQAYEPFRPLLSAEPGLVPPLSAQPVTEVPGGRVVGFGAAQARPVHNSGGDGINRIVMSRDGTEGWALGPGSEDDFRATGSLYHFDGTRWSKCDPFGIEGVVPPDPACAGVAEVAKERVKFVAAARVPTENGDDSSRAGEFEAVAIAKYSGLDSPKDAVVRLRDGRWSVDREWSRQLWALKDTATQYTDIAFGAPDDGWIVGNRGTTRDPLLFRLGEPDGEWIDCTGDGLALTAIQQRTKAKCLDADGVLPQSKGDSPGSSLGIQGLRVTSVGTRVYLYGTRRAAGGSSQTALLDATIGSTTGNKTPGYPVVLHEDSKDGDERAWMQDYDPKYDPACAEDCQTASRGTLNSLSVVRDSQGNHVGWGLGSFRAQDAPSVDDSISQGVTTPLLELVADGKPFEAWEPVDDPGPAALEYLLPPSANETGGTSLIGEIVTLPGGSAVAQRDVSAGTRGPASVWRNPASGRWEALQAPFIPRGSTGLTQQANISALAPDNRGGLWLGAKSLGNETWFYRYTTKVNAAVFADVAHPIREPISASAVGGDGSYWVATLSGTVYRHDRITGWDRVSLKGWDAGVVQSPAHAIAVGEDGQGLVVGKAGRIATIGPRAVGLDLKAVLCSADKSNCATTRTLRAAAVAPGGSALAGGENRSLIWRAPGGAFQPVRPLPQTAASATITSISFPTPTRAWLATSNGEVMAGSLQGESWSWTPENLDADGSSLSRAADGAVLALNAVAVDARGHGYAVGEHGVILERTGDGARPWRRVAAGVTEHLRSLALSSDGRGALIGGDAGLILTKAGDRFGVARHSSYFDPLTTSAQNVMGGVVGVGLVPGAKAGDVEAWAATQVTAQNPSPTPPTGSILHYTNRPDEPLLGAGAGRVEPMPDTSIRQDGELDLAAFGKSDCQLASECPELTGSALANDAVARAVRDALVEDRPDLAVFTGDANDVGGSREHELAQHPLTESIMHERWSEIVADPLSRKDIPVYGALGGQDISQTQACIPPNKVECHGQHQVGLNLAWRKTFAGAAAPWGNTRDPRSHSGLTFEEVKSDHEVDTGQAALAGARTHYAVDVKRGGQRILRLVVLDTSLKTTSGTAALQNPVAEQLAWLDEVLSKEPRDEGQLSVVVSETPSYAYNNSAGATTDTLADSTAFETVLVKNKVAAVISGRLGWNGLYWVLAPGLHTPCPGGAYQEAPPGDAAQLCGASDASPQEAADGVAETLEGPLGQPVPRPSQETRKALGTFSIPVAVAASAGGKFGPDGSGSGSGSQGFWRGYTRIRLFPGRKPTEELDPVFEQRPVFDWIGVNAREHTLTPGRRMKIAGFGREPVGIDQPARYVDIDGPAITHRYNLVLADPARPHLPKIDPTSELPNHYVAVPDEVGAKIEPQTGEVTYSGRGNRPPVYALAILSVGKQAVSWPIVFAPRRSFKLAPPPRAPRVQLPPPPRPLSATPATLPPTPNTPISTPPNLQLTFPPTPQLPNLSLNTPQTQAPPPPAPPPPPVSPAASALQITPSPVGLNVAPATTVIPPPAPPIQPAPPGGARREARQRQAAAAKSEEGGDQSAGQESSGGENTQASTRLDQPRDLAFTAHAEHHQASAWSRGLLYGGGLGIAALTLALGWSLMRPGPRRRGPELPAVAWARVQRRP